MNALSEALALLLKKSVPSWNKMEAEPDLGFVNIPEVTERSHLCESTILSLTHLNYLNFEDSLVNSNLKNEISEIALMEKIVFLVLCLYVGASKHRFLEHREKGKSVLN